MRLTVNWRAEIRELWGIHFVDHQADLPANVLWVTRCSRTKNDAKSGMPKDLYVSPVNRYFYRTLERWGERYAVLSDYYGLHFDNEELEWYDVHPSGLSRDDKERLGQIIREKATQQGFNTIIFYAPAPLMSIPYFEMLYFSGLDRFYTTKLFETHPEDHICY